jgi:hypothetical protein
MLAIGLRINPYEFRCEMSPDREEHTLLSPTPSPKPTGNFTGRKTLEADLRPSVESF